MRRLLVVLAMVGLASAAEALTVRDVIDLSRAGVGEDILLALVEVDGGVYAIDNKTLIAMKEAGVPPKVIVAMVKSGRERPVPEALPEVPPDEAAPPPAPQVVVIDHQPPVREVLVPVPVYVPVVPTRHASYPGGAIHRRHVESTYVPFQTGPPPREPQTPTSPPVYWGFGGKLRPDAWKPEGHQSDQGKPDGRRPADPK